MPWLPIALLPFLALMGLGHWLDRSDGKRTLNENRLVRWFLSLKHWQQAVSVFILAAGSALVAGLIGWPFIIATIVLFYLYAAWLVWSAWKRRNAARPSA